MSVRVGAPIETALGRRDFLFGAGALAFIAAGAIKLRPAFASEGASEDVHAVTAAYNACGHELVGALAGADGNIVLSPYSIGAAMAMVLAGARGATEAELVKTLRHSLSVDRIPAASGTAMATLLGYDSSHDPKLCPQGMNWNGQNCEAPAVNGACRHGMLQERLLQSKCTIGPIIPFVRLSIANALMLDKDLGALISTDYRNLVKDRFAAEVFPGASLAEVNDWVRQRTDGKIDKILDNLSDLSVAVLLNAIYLRVAWAYPFYDSGTAKKDFNLSAKQRVQASMMSRGSSDPVVRGSGFRAIRLALAAPQLSMIIVLPNDIEGLAEVSRGLDARAQADLLKALDRKEGASSGLQLEAKGGAELALPKFKVAFGADLVPPFQKLGLSSALSNQADFSGMTTGSAKIKIGQIRHRTVFEIAEDGVEAAAATAVEMVETSARAEQIPPREPFIVDRPFLFFLADHTTGAVLFEGRIVDPTKTA
jgi:serpin B